MKKWIALAAFYGLLIATYLGLGIVDQVRSVHDRMVWSAKTGQAKTQEELKKSSSEILHPASACCTDKVPTPRDHPPLRILIGDGVYSVVYAPHDWLQANHAYAMSDPDQHLIILDRHRNAFEVRQDLVHELLHIALRTGGGKRSYGDVVPDEEKFIQPMADPLLNSLTDNPELVKWLMKAGD
jgi:hypothetical protein